MIYPNGQRILTYPGRHMAGSLAASGALAYGGLCGARFNRFVSETYSPVVGAVPSGYSGRAYILAPKAGGIGGASGLAFTSSGAIVGGVTADGTTSLTFTVADAQAFPLDDTPPARTASASITFSAEGTGGLIATASGTASLTFTVADALLVASLGGSGSASLAITTNTPLLGAIADGSGEATFSISCAPAQMYPLNDASPLRTGAATITFSGLLTPYAIGHMVGSTADTSTLSTAAIASAVRGELATELARIDVRVGTRASQADVFAAG